MPKVTNYEDYEDGELNYSKIRCPKGHKGKIIDQAIGIPRQSDYRDFIHPARTLEDFSFLTDDLKTKDLEEYFLKDFKEIYMDFTHDEMMEEYTSNFNDLKGEHYWLDTSFMIKHGMISGTHPEYGELKLCELSFLHAINNGLSEIDEKYGEMAKEVKHATNNSTKELRKAIQKPYVYLTPQIIDEMDYRKDLFKNKVKTHKEKKHLRYLDIINERYKRTRLLSGAIKNKTTSNKRFQKDSTSIEDNRLENNIYNYCHNIALKKNTGTSIADNHLVSYAMTKAIETDEPQVILTRDNGIFKLSREISNVGRTMLKSKDYIPKFYLNNCYIKPTKLHMLELIPEF
jgi:hypothetical protein